MPSNVFVRRRLQVSAIQGSFWPRNFRELLGTESQRHVVPTWHVSRAVLYRRLEVFDSRAAVQPWAHELPKWLQFKCLWNCQSATKYATSNLPKIQSFRIWIFFLNDPNDPNDSSEGSLTLAVYQLTPRRFLHWPIPWGEKCWIILVKNVKLSSVKNTGVSSPCSHTIFPYRIK